RLGFDDERTRRLFRVRIEMLMHAVIVDDRNVAGLPVVAHAVVHLVAGAVEDVERRLVDVAMLAVDTARRVFLEVDMQRLRKSIGGLDVMPAESLRPVVELEVAALDDAGRRAK